MARLGVDRTGLFNGLIPVTSLAAVVLTGTGTITPLRSLGALAVLAGVILGLGRVPPGPAGTVNPADHSAEPSADPTTVGTRPGFPAGFPAGFRAGSPAGFLTSVCTSAPQDLPVTGLGSQQVPGNDMDAPSMPR
jgi:hypothetical protein